MDKPQEQYFDGNQISPQFALALKNFISNNVPTKISGRAHNSGNTSITANTPLWIFFWIISRSTSVSWITGCVQCRFSLSSPPKAFFIAPVVVVKTCVFTVGRWMMF